MSTEWTDTLNRIMEYVEKNIYSEINEKDIASIACCTYSSFQSIFSQITGISFMEYVRRRRLTMAAYDLQNSDKSIIDIALDYGYQNDDTFRVAFKSMFGINPSDARKKNVNLTFYCKLNFEIHIKGIDRMEYQIFNKEKFDVIGIRKVTSSGGGTWGVIKNDGTDEKIRRILGRRLDLGICFGFDKDGNDDYMCAMSTNGIPVEKIKECFDTIPGLVRFTFPFTTWLRFESRGRISDSVLDDTWTKINSEFLPSSRFHKGILPTIERYIIWDQRYDDCVVEILIPQ